MSPAGIMVLFHFIIIPVILLRIKRNDNKMEGLPFPPVSFFAAILFVILCVVPAKVALCDSSIMGSPIEFYPPRPAAEPGVPEPLSPPPPPPEIPELAQPLLDDRTRRQELAIALGAQFVNRNTFSDLREQMEILEMRMLLEKRIEAALVEDGYRPADLIRKRLEVRDVLFYNNNARPFTEQTLRRYLSQIDNSGTRSSVPYRKVVTAIRNYSICL